MSARLGDVDLAARYFHESAAIDLAGATGNAAGGVHIASLGGLWQATVLGMGGIRLRDGGLLVNPHLPPAWDELSFPLQWRGRALSVTITRRPEEIAVELRSGDPMTIELQHGTITKIESTHRYIARRSGSGWSRWQESGRPG